MYDDLVRQLAVTQRGALTTPQLHRLGLSDDAIRHRVREGSLVRIAPRVCVIGGVPIAEPVRIFAAWLECGGRRALSHGTAAAHWGFPGFSASPIEIVRLRDGVFPRSRWRGCTPRGSCPTPRSSRTTASS